MPLNGLESFENTGGLEEGRFGFRLGGDKSRKWKCLKMRGKIKSLVLGEEVGFHQVIHMTNQTLVGRESGRSFAIKTMVEWAWSV